MTSLLFLLSPKAYPTNITLLSGGIELSQEGEQGSETITDIFSLVKLGTWNLIYWGKKLNYFELTVLEKIEDEYPKCVYDKVVRISLLLVLGLSSAQTCLFSHAGQKHTSVSLRDGRTAQLGVQNDHSTIRSSVLRYLVLLGCSISTKHEILSLHSILIVLWFVQIS